MYLAPLTRSSPFHCSSPPTPCASAAVSDKAPSVTVARYPTNIHCKLALLVRVLVVCATVVGTGLGLLLSQSLIRSARPSGTKKGTFGMSLKTVAESRQVTSLL